MQSHVATVSSLIPYVKIEVTINYSSPDESG